MTVGSPAEAARAYRELGWAVIPFHTPAAGACSCGREDCPASGKHPRVRWRGYTEQAPTVDELQEWWRRWPDANPGVVTGLVSGVVVLDVDPRGGGGVALQALIDRWGALPTTAESRTGGGGRHLFFACPSDPLPTTLLAGGLELKATAGTAVVPPSLHASGRRYAWLERRDPWATAPSPLPRWLAALAAGTVAEAPRRHPLGDPPDRTADEQQEFAEVWHEVGVTLQDGDRYYVCPFHDDHHPSLHVDAEGCRWFCFGCRRGGGIGALRRATGRPRPSPHRERLTGSVGPRERITLAGRWRIDVVGESHHQDELLELTGGVRHFGGVDVRAVAHLEPEPGNRFDPDAVAVHIGGLTVGYLRHADAVRLRPSIDAAIAASGVATCRARVRGGWDRGRGEVGAFGVVLQLPETV